MTRGETLAITGQVGPPLASTVAVKVTSPSGAVGEFEGVANAIGYFYQPESNLTLDETGVWTVQVRVTHEGMTSAGIVEAPFPTGVMRYQVYVVDDDAPPLDSNQRSGTTRPGLPINFVLTPPAGWTNITAYQTVRLPGHVVSDGPVNLSQGRLNYQYNPAAMSRDFPSLEFDGAGEGPAGSDVVTITFAITGIDEDGNPAIRTRTYYVMHDRLFTD
jgi:hypothetical protein